MTHSLIRYKTNVSQKSQVKVQMDYLNHKLVLEAAVVVSAGGRGGDEPGHGAVHLGGPRARRRIVQHVQQDLGVEAHSGSIIDKK